MSFRNSARSRAVCSSLFAMGFSFHIYFSRFCFSGNNRVITCSRSRSSSEPPSRADEAHGAKPGGTTRPGSSRLALPSDFIPPRSALRPRPALSRGSLAVVLPPFSGRRENGALPSRETACGPDGGGAAGAQAFQYQLQSRKTREKKPCAVHSGRAAVMLPSAQSWPAHDTNRTSIRRSPGWTSCSPRATSGPPSV